MVTSLMVRMLDDLGRPTGSDRVDERLLRPVQEGGNGGKPFSPRSAAQRRTKTMAGSPGQSWQLFLLASAVRSQARTFSPRRHRPALRSRDQPRLDINEPAREEGSERRRPWLLSNGKGCPRPRARGIIET